MAITAAEYNSKLAYDRRMTMTINIEFALVNLVSIPQYNTRKNGLPAGVKNCAVH